jgi:malate dehydrogenase (oxaloacetate-decarboxylating)
LVHTGRPDLEPFKQRYARDKDSVSRWQVDEPGRLTLLDVVRNAKASILLGTSAQPGAFTEQVVREMAKHTERPVIFPLSNPTSRCEAVPADLINWTGGRALVATGSPFEPVTWQGQVFNIGQCNNAFVFPGVGLGVIASGARRVTNEMFVAASRALAEFSPAVQEGPKASLYPALENVQAVSSSVALAVGTEAQRLGLCDVITEPQLRERIAAKMWSPRYAKYVRAV